VKSTFSADLPGISQGSAISGKPDGLHHGTHSARRTIFGWADLLNILAGIIFSAVLWVCFRYIFDCRSRMVGVASSTCMARPLSRE
jgi:hypothetical protein